MSADILDTELVSGISVFFALIFYAPLGVVAIGFWCYSAFARRSVLTVAKVLSTLWLLACIPAALMILMGYAFNSAKMSPLIVIPLWVLLGLAVLWLPVGLRVVFRIRPV
ncbi:MAG: hypothetical protein JNN18_15400 [Rubrivivax sp.]|jgi:hypothetical protein|nr:hypothetical protein [Rubrivivax sp.]